MKRILMGGLLAAASLLGGLALTSGGASATNNTNHPECNGIQYKDQPPNSGTTVTAAYSGTISIKVSTEHLTVPSTKGATYSPANVAGWPTSASGNYQDISHVDYCVPKPEWKAPTYPDVQFGACAEYRLEKSTSTWDADTGEWSAWTDWPGVGPLAWGELPANLTGHHGGEHEKDGDRHFAYVIVDQRPLVTPECVEQPPTPDPTYEWGDCSTGDNSVYGIKTTYKYEWQDGAWVAVVDEVTKVSRPLTEDEQAACRPPDKVRKTEWVDGAYECDDTTVEQTRTKTTWSYSYVEGEWVQDEPVVTEQTRRRELDEDEITECPQPVEVTPKYTYTPPTCFKPGDLSFEASDNYEVIDNRDGTYTFVANEGSVFPKEFKATVGPFATAQVVCTEDPPAVVPPAAEPPAAAAPQATVAAAGPVPPAAAPAAAPPAPAQTALPSTGSSSWGLALAALASLLGGLGLVRLSRRTS